MNNIEKHLKIMRLLEETYDLLVAKFFDMESEEMLDEKIEVLTALKEGKTPAEIPNYYKILEKYPKDDEMWDL